MTEESRKLNELIDDVEELLGELKEHIPQDELKNRLRNTIDSAKRAGGYIRHYAGSVDNYITGYPRLGFLTGILVGGAVGYLAGLTRSKEQ